MKNDLIYILVFIDMRWWSCNLNCDIVFNYGYIIIVIKKYE